MCVWEWGKIEIVRKIFKVPSLTSFWVLGLGMVGEERTGLEE